ncbi:sugar ABC transporter substrate-binding protein [candidate division KSB3 bacterium]|uniref:Sugar ABC transporter substrate-binding protein n=1 Tax=candidate division KSB3 bacterium TaxID=2044937 RepID=A0A2G6E173_9BACT|nr:MAG: sugar ABC transporter substrate-binding protein [candidate division KSB3 bacterium]PIE28445.1 MAG: sugar ABC transporter substrate-binding protein [candidate division KSB3 bacterium]
MKKGLSLLMLVVCVTGLLMAGMAFAEEKTYKVAFITTTMAHSVPAAWHEGIKRAAEANPSIEYEVADGEWRADVQIAKIEDYINRGFDALILQAQDAAALAASVREAEEAGIFVVTLNLDVTVPHAALVTMVTDRGGRLVAQEMAKDLGEKGNVVILQSPPGASIGIDRERGFREEIGKYPEIKIIAAQNAEWRKDKAFAIMQSLLQSNSQIDGVYGVNDSMAEGAALAAEQAGKLEGMSVWGLDGEKDALSMIEEGKLTGTIYTNCFMQGELALKVVEELLTSGKSPQESTETQVVEVDPMVVRKENVGEIKPEDRW